MGSLGRGNPGQGSRDRESRDRGSGDNKKSQSFHRHASGVSSALWPADMRRSLATGRVAQRRRSVAMGGKRGVLLAATLRVGTSLALVLTSMFVGGTIVAALALRLEYVLLIPAAILTVMTLLITPSLLLKLHRASRPAPLQRPPSTDLRGLSFSPMKRRMPETPLPVAPLVRVLETYDLSQANFDYFDTARTEERDNAELSPDRNIEHPEKFAL